MPKALPFEVGKTYKTRNSPNSLTVVAIDGNYLVCRLHEIRWNLVKYVSRRLDGAYHPSGETSVLDLIPEYAPERWFIPFVDHRTRGAFLELSKAVYNTEGEALKHPKLPPQDATYYKPVQLELWEDKTP